MHGDPRNLWSQLRHRTSIFGVGADPRGCLADWTVGYLRREQMITPSRTQWWGGRGSWCRVTRACRRLGESAMHGWRAWRDSWARSRGIPAGSGGWVWTFGRSASPRWWLPGFLAASPGWLCAAETKRSDPLPRNDDVSWVRGGFCVRGNGRRGRTQSLRSGEAIAAYQRGLHGIGTPQDLPSSV
jgi:hypothetical protein